MRTSDTAARIVPLDSRAVEDVLGRAQELIAGYDEELRRELTRLLQDEVDRAFAEQEAIAAE